MSGLLRDPEQGALAQYFKQEKTIKRACGFFLFKTLWGEQDYFMIRKGEPLRNILKQKTIK